MMHMEETSDFCTISEAARKSGLALKTWYQGGAGTDAVPRIRFGRSVRLLRADVERFINDRIMQAKTVVQTEQVK
jgi:predicted DNA-binding transcriptional regulator AlpA